jgi:hypothetical protein
VLKGREGVAHLEVGDLLVDLSCLLLLLPQQLQPHTHKERALEVTTTSAVLPVQAKPVLTRGELD